LEGSHAKNNKEAGQTDTLMREIKSVLFCLGLAFIPVLFTGCASVTCGSHQDVALYSKPLGANVIVYNNHGEIVYKGTTPCVAKLARTAPESERANYIVLLQKEGYQDVQMPLKSQLNRAGVASAFAGALIVDSDVGGAWTLVPAADVPELAKENPDMIHPDGVCLAMTPESASTAKVQTASK
jgi:hypothetical protein